MNDMTKTAKTIFVYSFYLFGMGAGLLVAPNVLLPIMGLETTSEIWIRMLGLFTFTVGIYYFLAARDNQEGFFRATVIGRIFFFTAVTILVIVLQEPVALVGVGCIDLIGAAWTYYSLKQDKN